MSNPGSSAAPKPWKFALLVGAFIYPVITLLNYFLIPFLMDLALPIRTLIFTFILVPLMAWVYIPFINKHFSGWLRR